MREEEEEETKIQNLIKKIEKLFLKQKKSKKVFSSFLFCFPISKISRGLGGYDFLIIKIPHKFPFFCAIFFLVSTAQTYHTTVNKKNKFFNFNIFFYFIFISKKNK